MGPWAILCMGVHFGYNIVEVFVSSSGGYLTEAAAQEEIDLQQNSLNYIAVQAWTLPSSSGAPVIPFNLAKDNWTVVVTSVDGSGSPSFFIYGGFSSEADCLAWIAGQGGRAGMSAVQVQQVP